MINYEKNLRKRIIFVIIGIVSYYFVPMPLGILFNSVSHEETFSSLWFFYAYKGIALSFLIGFLYVALVQVKPSLIPKKTKYRQVIVASILIITILSIMVPSGLIVSNWKQGQCLIKSGTFNENGMLSGTTSSGVGSELECMQDCKFSGRVIMNEEKTCEFNGLFGSRHWVKTPEDFADVEDKISLND